MSLGAVADAANATSRLRGAFEAELLEETHRIEESLDVALDVQGASWTWDAPPPNQERGKKKSKQKGHSPSGKKNPEGAAKVSDPTAQQKGEEMVFKVEDVSFRIPRGKLVGVVGSVGSGKSSLLQGLIGEMRRTSGSVTFGGTVSYCPQSAWIQVKSLHNLHLFFLLIKAQNATIRENVCFGRPFEEEKYWKAISDACLEPDLAMLPNGDLTEVGERVCHHVS